MTRKAPRKMTDNQLANEMYVLDRNEQTPEGTIRRETLSNELHSRMTYCGVDMAAKVPPNAEQWPEAYTITAERAL